MDESIIVVYYLRRVFKEIVVLQTKNIFIVLWDVDGPLVYAEQLHRTKHTATMETFIARFGTDRTIRPNIEEAHETPQTFFMPNKNGKFVETTTALYGTSDRHYYYWFIDKVAGLKKLPTLEEWLEEETCYYETAADDGRLEKRNGSSEILHFLEKMNNDNLTVIQGIVTRAFSK